MSKFILGLLLTISSYSALALTEKPWNIQVTIPAGTLIKPDLESIPFTDINGLNGVSCRLYVDNGLSPVNGLYLKDKTTVNMEARYWIYEASWGNEARGLTITCIQNVNNVPTMDTLITNMAGKLDIVVLPGQVLTGR